MFGYIRPQREELKVREDHHYAAAYCGLCHNLGKRYGFAGRCCVSYDITFLYLLLAQGAQQMRCFCPAKPWKKKPCLCGDAAMDYAADVNVILSYWKLMDERADSHGLRRMAASIAAMCLRRAWKRATARQPGLDARVSRQLKTLSELEVACCESMDRVADAFAVLLQHCADGMLTGEKRPAQQLLYHVGRYIYLVDALDDLPRDLRQDAYNPLRYRFDCSGGKLPAAERQYLCRSIDESISLAATALELMEGLENRSILENIIYLGMPAVLRAVEHGTFENKRKI